MALFCDTFNHFKVEAWLNDPGFNSDSPQFGSNSPPGRKRKRISGRVHSPSRAATPRSPISPRHPCAPTQARRPLQATTRSNMAARAGQDADPIKSPTKPLMTRATPTTLPNRPRRQSPRKTAAPSSSVRTAKGEATVTSRRRVLQDNTGAELRGRPPVDFDPQIQDYARTLSIVRDIFPPLTATESQSSKQTRSTSPSKTMHDLAMADPPIRFYEARSIRPPEEVAKLYQRISHTCRGSKLLPHSVKVRTEIHHTSKIRTDSHRMKSCYIPSPST
jgi:hypothetical protein